MDWYEWLVTGFLVGVGACGFAFWLWYHWTPMPSDVAREAARRVLAQRRKDALRQDEARRAGGARVGRTASH